MDINDIKRIIANDENRVLELKKTTGELVKGVQTLCAFLNTDGGWLFFGITPKLEVIGQDVTDSTQREIAHEITKIEPAVNLPIEIVDVPEHQGRCVIGIHCDAAKFGDAPYTYDGRAYYKVESTTKLMPRSMFEERLRRSNPNRFAWESQTPDYLHYEDLDESRIKGAVSYGVDKGRMPASAMSESAWSLLDKMAMIGDGKIKNAAAALFIKRPSAYPQFLLRLARFRGTEKKAFIDNARAKGNFFELLDAGMSFMFKHLSQSGVVKGLRREEQLEIPVEALREALINALCHRLLDSPSGSVGISIFDDRVEIENTGHLPNELTVETIKLPHRSYPQNPIIADALYMTAFLESWGTGVSRMVDACKSVGLPEPEYGTDGAFVWITFKRPSPDTNLDNQDVTSTDTYSDTNFVTQGVTSPNPDTNPDNQVVTSPNCNSVTYSVTYSDTNPDNQAVTSPYSDTNTDNQIVTSTDTNSYSDTNPDNQAVTNIKSKMTLSDKQKEVVAYCIIPRSSREILEHIDVTYQNRNIVRFILTLIEEGYLVRTFPDSPNAPTQKYVAKRKIM